jgi:hypothetical protein
MKVTIWDKRDCKGIWQARREAEWRKLEKLERILFWQRIAGIVLGSIYIIGKVG